MSVLASSSSCFASLGVRELFRAVSSSSSSFSSISISSMVRFLLLLLLLLFMDSFWMRSSLRFGYIYFSDDWD